MQELAAIVAKDMQLSSWTDNIEARYWERERERERESLYKSGRLSHLDPRRWFHETKLVGIGAETVEGATLAWQIGSSQIPLIATGIAIRKVWQSQKSRIGFD
jgi:hypothetical protein